MKVSTSVWQVDAAPAPVPRAWSDRVSTITTPAMTGIGGVLGRPPNGSGAGARETRGQREDGLGVRCVLYETLTGRRAFDGDDVTMVMASIVKSEPDWNALPAETPDAVRTILRGCLQKDSRRRIRDIGDVRLALDGAFVSTGAQRHVTEGAPSPQRFRRAIPWIAGAIAGSVLTGVAAWAVLGAGNTPTVSAKRFALVLPEGETLPPGTGTLVAISPDGQTGSTARRRRTVTSGSSAEVWASSTPRQSET